MSRIKFTTWTHFIENVIQLPFDDEMEDTYEATGDYSLECLVELWARSMMAGFVDLSKKNPFGFESTGSFYGKLRFPTWTAAIEEWRKRRGDWHYQWELRQKPTLDELYEAVVRVDTQPQPDPEPIPDRLSQPMQGDLARWYGPVQPFSIEHPVCHLWLLNASSTLRFPALLDVTETDRGEIYNFSDGLRILHTDTFTEIMYID